MKHSKSIIFSLLGLVIVLCLAACSTGTTSTTTATPTSRTSATTPVATTTPTQANTSGTTTAQATLKHVPTGSASLNWDATTQKLVVKITLSGLAPKSTHPAHIYKGSCVKQGDIYLPLQSVVADAAGNATSTTTINSFTGGIPAGGLYINVHNGPTLNTANEALPIVCGDISNAQPSLSTTQLVELQLNAAPGSVGQSAMGTAQMKLNAGTLTVHLQLSGLAPNTTHAAHIHTGTCTNQDAVIYPLSSVVANAQGNADVTTTIKNVTSIPASGWYVNVHNSMDLATQTGFDPIACGNVALGS